MSDLISRWDVIKAVLGSNFSACTVYGRSEEGMATARELIQAIKKLPSVQPEERFEFGKWYDFKRGYVLETTVHSFRILKDVEASSNE